MSATPARPHTRRGAWMARASEADRLAAEHRQTGHDDHQTAACPLCVKREHDFHAHRGTGD